MRSGDGGTERACAGPVIPPSYKGTPIARPPAARYSQ